MANKFCEARIWTEWGWLIRLLLALLIEVTYWCSTGGWVHLESPRQLHSCFWEWMTHWF